MCIRDSSKGDFKIKQTLLNEISSGKNLSGKSYKGIVNGWPGGLTGAEVLEHMINKAAEHGSAFDPNTGYNYPQLISKFARGAVFYNQAVDNYLDEKLGPDNKPNNNSATFLVRQKEDMLGKQKQQSLTSRFRIDGIREIRHGVLWNITVNSGNFDTAIKQLSLIHI